MSKDQQLKMVNDHAAKLIEHFDAVQILVSLCDENGDTQMVYSGKGNWFARHGMANDFIHKDNSRTSAEIIKDALNPPTDDGEAWKQA